MSNWSEGIADEESYSWTCNRCGREYDLDHYNDIDDHVDTHRDQYGQLRDGSDDEPDEVEQGALISREEGSFELLMGLPIAESAGGPFNDAALVAGLNLGRIEAAMSTARSLGSLPRDQYVDPRWIPLLDLFAMRYKFEITYTPYDEHWTLAVFELGLINPPNDASSLTGGES